MTQALAVIALKTGLLMCAAGLVSLALMRSSAATRHLVWVSALGLALLLPLASALMPSYAVMDDPWAVPAQIAVAARPVAQANGWSDLLRAGLLAAWGAGALSFMLRDTLGRAVLVRFSRRAGPLVSPHWAASLQAVERRGAMRVLETDRVEGPCTWGFFRPTLVLPSSAGHWSEAERRYALTHEFAHIERRDYVSTAIARLACAVHWYNPLVWYAARQAHELQEQACDDAVLRAGAVPSDYAQLLVGIARSGCCSLRAAMGMAERSPLYHRVRAILDPGQARAAQSRSRALATMVPLSCAMALIAGAGLAEPEVAHAAEAVAAAAVPARVAETKPARAAVPHRHRAPAAPPPPQAVPPVPATPALPALLPVAAVPPLPAMPPPPAPLEPVPPLPAIPPLPSD